MKHNGSMAYERRGASAEWAAYVLGFVNRWVQMGVEVVLILQVPIARHAVEVFRNVVLRLLLFGPKHFLTWLAVVMVVDEVLPELVPFIKILLALVTPVMLGRIEPVLPPRVLRWEVAFALEAVAMLTGV
jgi:hypothetical protein